VDTLFIGKLTEMEPLCNRWDLLTPWSVASLRDLSLGTADEKQQVEQISSFFRSTPDSVNSLALTRFGELPGA
jgi:hypothetical protein